MRIVYDTQGRPVTVATDEDADDMIKYCGYTAVPSSDRNTAGYALPDHQPPPVVERAARKSIINKE